jgi:hypothetical protein
MRDLASISTAAIWSLAKDKKNVIKNQNYKGVKVPPRSSQQGVFNYVGVCLSFFQQLSKVDGS